MAGSSFGGGGGSGEGSMQLETRKMNMYQAVRDAMGYVVFVIVSVRGGEMLRLSRFVQDRAQ